MERFILFWSSGSIAACNNSHFFRHRRDYLWCNCIAAASVSVDVWRGHYCWRHIFNMWIMLYSLLQSKNFRKTFAQKSIQSFFSTDKIISNTLKIPYTRLKLFHIRLNGFLRSTKINMKVIIKHYVTILL